MRRVIPYACQERSFRLQSAYPSSCALACRVRHFGFAFRSRGRGARRGPFHFHATLAAVPRKGAAGCVMQHLRHPSPRPSVVVDPAAFGVVDPSPAFVGRPGPLGRERVMSALPLNPGPALLSPPYVVRDAGSSFLADPDGALIGEPAVWVNRMLTARWTEDTRRLG